MSAETISTPASVLHFQASSATVADCASALALSANASTVLELLSMMLERPEAWLQILGISWVPGHDYVAHVAHGPQPGAQR